MYTEAVMHLRFRHAVLLFVLACVSLATAQQVRISKSFSVAAVNALHAINSTGWALPDSVRELEARQADAQSKMDDAKDAAETEDDADVFVYLQRYQLRHSQNFADYTNAITRTARQITPRNQNVDTAALRRAAAQVAKDPQFIQRKKKETACAAAIEKQLQARTFSQPAACDLY